MIASMPIKTEIFACHDQIVSLANLLLHMVARIQAIFWKKSIPIFEDIETSACRLACLKFLRMGYPFQKFPIYVVVITLLRQQPFFSKLNLI